MPKFQFKAEAVETQYGTAYFEVEAETEDEARKLLAGDSAEYYYDFSERDGNVDWEASKPEDFEVI